jgi:hypothetical protein
MPKYGGLVTWKQPGRKQGGSLVWPGTGCNSCFFGLFMRIDLLVVRHLQQQQQCSIYSGINAASTLAGVQHAYGLSCGVALSSEH